MSTNPPPRPALPEGWYYPDDEDSRDLQAELERELPPGHLLFGRAVAVVAWREGATDDTLVQHLAEPERLTVVHLTWLGRTEIDADHPTVEFDGTFAEFLAFERRFSR